MSWMKRRGPPTPNPTTTPPVQMYNPNQHSNQDWQQPVTNSWYNQNPQPDLNQQQQPNYWQNQYPQQNAAPPYNQYPNQYNQQNAQAGYYQQQNYDQNYSNGQQYGFVPENNVLPEHQNAESGDSWNWGWGDEDNSNVQLAAQQNTVPNTNPATSNVVTDSFANDESWNWNVEETASQSYPKQEPTGSNTVSEHSLHDSKNNEALFPKVGDLVKINSSDNMQYQAKTESTAENYESISLNQLPAMPTGKRLKNEHLTPQWSIESQVSQESSDDVLPTSESDKSHIFSRSSTISHSPVSGQQTPLEPNNPPYMDHYPIKHEANFETYNRENASSIHENKEILSKIKEEVPIKQDPSSPPPTMNQTPPLPSKNQTPPPPMKNQTPPPPTKVHTPPPPGVIGLKNPYKRNMVLSHKAINQVKSGSTDSRPSNSYYMAPFTPAFNQNVNLETVPDNSEQPDIMPTPVPNSSVKPISTSQQYPENNEVAPINDRNQYLETGQLSDENTNHARDDTLDALPPPGLSRMVLGQMEQNECNSRENQGDNEPPPGLSRMVLGQTENSGIQMSSPPAGLHRMIPGESSSPETSSRYPNNMCLEDDYVSEAELNQLGQIPQQSRSATIGADTPPVETPALLNIANRSETIGSNGDSDQREMNLDGANASDINGDRRDSIEGQPQNSDMDNLVSSVRDLVVGENTTDSQNASKLAAENARRHDTSESEGDRGKSPHDRRDRRYKDDRREKDRNRERDRDRYSPEYSRDKRSDRRRNRDRYYEEDTDYFSDKERNRRREERVRREGREDYDKNYNSNSLRKDKDKDKDMERRKRDGREGRDNRDYRDGRDTRRDYYYGRYEDDYDDPQRSRPSSRSDSMHESYRERGPEREHRRHDRDRRRQRDQYNHYMQGYGYDPYNPYYQQYQYQYLENLRRTNPQAYAEWFRKYYQQSGQQSGQFNMEDKASVHSGRSSANDELAKERYLRQSYYGHSSMPHIAGYYREQQSISSHYGMDDSSVSRPFEYAESSQNFEDTTVSQRMTPAKFSTAHAKASINSGRLVKILPHYPIDGQAAVVEINQIQGYLQGDNELKEFMEFPGPLIKGVTHKKTIIEYCENKIKNHALNDEITDPDSYVLMWELLILLLRQNGMVVGTDIAELLMKDRRNDHGLRPSSVASSNSGMVEVSEPNLVGGDANNSSTTSVMKEEYVTNKFREYLLYGSEKEALEWAMKHSLWGHALFLASKLDKRTYANVMMRFANGLPLNDPLQTLYQLLSGRLPASVTSVYDDKWGDWRPHLAMILSNTTQRPELDRKAITTLADTLMLRGSLFAAQFCYLMAEVGFSRYGSEGAKLVLLGSNHSKPFKQFATNEAIYMTEVYEYACSLNESAFIIPEFQAYKYLVATRLADRGFLENALSYLEQVAGSILQNPSAAQPSLITKICDLADRLKYYDPVVDEDEVETEIDLDASRPDNTWLKDLKLVQQEYNMGLITHESMANLNMQSMNSLQEHTQSYDNTPQDPWKSQQQVVEQEQYQQTNVWQTEPQIEQTSNEYSRQENTQEGYSNQYSEQTWNQQQPWANTGQQVIDPYGAHNQEQMQPSQEQQHDYWNNAQTEDIPRPQISMPNQSKAPYQDDDVDHAGAPLKKDSPLKPKLMPKKDDKHTANTGWFGGIWSRLALRPKNQMKLPDDKNPTIVWDQEKKRWVNLEEDGNETTSELRPPPKMSDMMQRPTPALISQPVQSQPPSSFGAPASNPPAPIDEVSNKPPASNMFKMQRNRNLKKSYVDVFNPGGKPSNIPNIVPSSDVLNSGQKAGPQMNFFIPAPVTDPNAPIDFLTPGGAMPMDPNMQKRGAKKS